MNVINLLRVRSWGSKKYALLLSSNKPTCLPADESCLPIQSSVKCLGVWWDSNLSSRLSIEEHIHKAHAAFFMNGQLGAFHGVLNPLSSKSIVECCVMPVLMYGSESWVLNSSLLSKLESFQSELGKRILKLSKYTSNNIPLLALR